MPAAVEQWMHHVSDDSVVRLIQEARRGSQEALGRLLDTFRAFLLQTANQELSADLQAKVAPSDLVQDTFIEANRDFEKFRGFSRDQMSAWLKQVLLNNIADAQRTFRISQKRDIGLEVPLLAASQSEQFAPALRFDDSPSAVLERKEECAIVQDAILSLPEKYRAVITLRHQDNLTFEAIGLELNCSAEAARKLWLRAIEVLRKTLANGQ